MGLWQRALDRYVPELQEDHASRLDVLDGVAGPELSSERRPDPSRAERHALRDSRRARLFSAEPQVVEGPAS